MLNEDMELVAVGDALSKLIPNGLNNKYSSFFEIQHPTIEIIDFNIAGLTMMSVDYNSVFKAVNIIKQVKPSTKVIVGGPHPSISPEEIV